MADLFRQLLPHLVRYPLTAILESEGRLEEAILAITTTPDGHILKNEDLADYLTLLYPNGQKGISTLELSRALFETIHPGYRNWRKK